MEPWVYELLKTALYQQLYLDKIPKRAVFNETIEIAKVNGHEGIRRFVTGILHEIERKGLPDPGNVKDSAEKISIESSTPKWLVEKLTEELGFEKTISLLKSINEPPAQSIRVNLAKIRFIKPFQHWKKKVSKFQKPCFTAWTARKRWFYSSQRCL